MDLNGRILRGWGVGGGPVGHGDRTPENHDSLEIHGYLSRSSRSCGQKVRMCADPESFVRGDPTLTFF